MQKLVPYSQLAGVECLPFFSRFRKAVTSGLALAVLLGAPLVAQSADVAWSVDEELTLPGTLFIDMTTGLVVTDNPSEYQISLSNFNYSDGTNQTVIATTFGGGVIYDFTEAVNLSEGATVDSSAAFWQSANLATKFNSGTVLSNFAVDNTGYVGLSFKVSADTYYGWASLLRVEDSALIKLTGFGYNDTPGAASTVGAIPEPSTIALLAGVGGILIALRLRRRMA